MAHAYNLSIPMPGTATLPTEPDAEFHPDEVFTEEKRFPTGVLYGFLREIASLRRQLPEAYIVIVWDGGYKERAEITKQAVSNGIIPSEYKSNRKHKSVEQINFYLQQKELKEVFRYTNIPQVLVKGEEADDVIFSFVQNFKSVVKRILVMTNDKDYLQLLHPNVLLKASEGIYGVEEFKSNYKIDPNQWVDVGALMGDDGDNIFGIPGWGISTALEAIQTHGDINGMFAAYHKEFDPLRLKFPDLEGEELQAFLQLKTPSNKVKYPRVPRLAPFSGVAMAKEKKLIKVDRLPLLALIHEEVVYLAKVLKQMRHIKVPSLPGIDAPPWNRGNKEQFLAFCDKFKLKETATDAQILCAQQGSPIAAQPSTEAQFEDSTVRSNL